MKRSPHGIAADIERHPKTMKTDRAASQVALTSSVVKEHDSTRPIVGEPSTCRNIDILAFDNVQLLDVAGPLQVFAAANKWSTLAGRSVPYRPRVVALAGSMAMSSSGLAIAVEPLPDESIPTDTLIVAGGAGIDHACEQAELRDWLMRRVERSRRIASVCTGAFLLARCGLLDGRRVVTHWEHCTELAERFPAIDVDADPIFVESGKIWTSAGVTAGIDLALAMVERDVGRDIALAVARDLVVFLKRPGGQSQFSSVLSLQSSAERFADLHDWIGRHLSADLSVPVLAERAGMSERSFVRHYGRAVGMTPARAVEQLRVDAARILLDDARLSIKRIAARCGFGSEETMRRSFLRIVRVTPQAYRERFS